MHGDRYRPSHLGVGASAVHRRAGPDTRDLIFPVAELVSRLSQSLTLYPGDLIYTGTPSGVGMGRDPKRFLVPGTLTSTIGGLGELTIDLVNGF